VGPRRRQGDVEAFGGGVQVAERRVRHALEA